MFKIILVVVALLGIALPTSEAVPKAPDGINKEIARTVSAHRNPKFFNENNILLRFLREANRVPRSTYSRSRNSNIPKKMWRQMQFPGARFISAHISGVDTQGPRGRMGQFPPSQRTGTDPEFSCVGRAYDERFYGDPADDCKTFYHCGDGWRHDQVSWVKIYCRDGKRFNENTCECEHSAGNCHALRGCIKWNKQP